MKGHIAAALIGGVCIVALATPAQAQERQFNIPSGSLKAALDAYGRQSGRPIIYKADDVRGVRSRGYRGNATPQDALTAILANTGFGARTDNSGAVAVVRLGNGQSAPDRASSSESDTSSGSEAGASGDDIVVTAQFREQRLRDVPMAISALRGEELRERGVTNLQQLAFAVPGFNLSQARGASGPNFLFLRGIGSNAGTQPLVGEYLDDLVVSGPVQRPLDIEALDLERVEVLYGPQGTLFGQGSAGGTIRFITNKPSFDRASVEASLDASFTKDGAASQLATGVINLPVVSDVFALRVMGNYQNLGGWVDAPSAGKKNINGSEIYNLRVVGTVNVTPSLTLTPLFALHRDHTDYSGNGEDTNGDKTLPPFAPTELLPTKTRYELLGLTGELDLGPARLTSITSYWNDRSDGTSTNQFGAAYRSFTFKTRDKSFSQEVRLSSNGGGPFNWTLGFFYRDVDFNSFINLTSGTGTTPTIVNRPVNSAEKSKSQSYFGNASYKITDQLEVGVGARYFTEDKSSPSTTGVQKGKFDSFDPRFFVTYAATERLNLYANFGKGFRSGGFNIINPSFPPTFGPETVYNYEVGAKFGSPVLRGAIALYRNDYKNMQVSALSPVSGLGYTGNIGEARIYGGDGTIELSLGSQTTIGGSVSWNDGKVTDIIAGADLAVGDRLNYIPKYSYGVFAQQKFSWAPSIPGTVRLDYNEKGKSVVISRTAGRSDQSGTINLLNARIGADFDPFSVSLYGENLLNDRDKVVPNFLNFAPRSKPRTIGVRLDAVF